MASTGLFPRGAAAATLALAVVAAGTVAAHHGFKGRYDTGSPFLVLGEVKDAVFGYPHAIVTVDLAALQAPPQAAREAFGHRLSPLQPDQPGAVKVELPPVPLFNDLEGRITRGDTIAMVVLRNCDPPHQLRAQFVAPAQGDPVLRVGKAQQEVTRC